MEEDLNDISTRQKLLEQRGELILKNGEEYYVTKIVNFPDEFQIIDKEDLPEGMEYEDLIPYTWRVIVYLWGKLSIKIVYIWTYIL